MPSIDAFLAVGISKLKSHISYYILYTHSLSANYFFYLEKKNNDYVLHLENWGREETISTSPSQWKYLNDFLAPSISQYTYVPLIAVLICQQYIYFLVCHMFVLRVRMCVALIQPFLETQNTISKPDLTGALEVFCAKYTFRNRSI